MIYLDTSFVVSLYSLDANSAVAAGILQVARGPRLISWLVHLETLNAMQLRVFRKEISNQDASASLQNFDRDVSSGFFQVQPLTEAVFARARSLSLQFSSRIGTRSADILHVAAALEFHATEFFTFDLQQRKMAQSVGLKLSSKSKRP